MLSVGNTLDLKHLVPPHLKYPPKSKISCLLGKGLSSCLTELELLLGNRAGGLLEGVSVGPVPGWWGGDTRSEGSEGMGVSGLRC